MNRSQTKTVPMEPDSVRTRAPNRGQGRKLEPETLPEPNNSIDETRREDLDMIVDFLNGADTDREVFDRRYKNADEVLDHYREILRAVVELEDENRDNNFAKLQRALHLHRKVVWQPAKKQVLDWAKGGYHGEPSMEYLDGNGQQREKLQNEDPEYMNMEADDTAAVGGEDIIMEESEPTLPENMEFYNAKWEAAKGSLTELMRHPKSYLDKSNKARVLLHQTNHQIKRQQMDKDQRCDVDLQIPVQNMLFTLIQCTDVLRRGEKAESERSIDVFGAAVERASQPSEWTDLLRTTTSKKSRLFEKYIEAGKDPQKSPGLWEPDFLKLLKTQHNTDHFRPETSNQADSGTSNQADSGASNQADSGTSHRPAAADSVPRGVFEPSTKKGFVRLKLKKDYVPYLGKERKVGGVRLFGVMPKGLGKAWQVLVQVNDEDAKLPFWHIVASSNFDRGMVDRYCTDNPGHVVVHDMKGTLADIGTRSIDTFNIGGIATVPRKPQEGMRNPMQLIRGFFDGDEIVKFWDRSTLGRAWRQKAVDEYIGMCLKEVGFAAFSPRRRQPKPRSRANHGLAEEGENIEEEEDDDESLDKNDGIYRNEGNDTFIDESDDFDGPPSDLENEAPRPMRAQARAIFNGRSRRQ